MIVVVTYRRAWIDVNAIASLRRLCDASAGLRIASRQVLIYENGDAPSLGSDAAAAGFQYVANRTNGGTRPAYVACRANASRLGLDWMVLLDHDTVTTPQYFAALAGAIVDESPPSSRVGAIVPQVFDGQVLISPSSLHYAGRLVPQRSLATTDRNSSAIASGSAFRCTAFDRLAPLPEHYWLDGLDHWMFWKLQRTGFSVRILDSRLEHSLSVRTLHAVTVQRYKDIVASEVHLSIDTMHWTERLVFRLRLLLRAAILVRRRLPVHATIAWSAAWRGTT